jgi:SAM-dependent methyltransferase
MAEPQNLFDRAAEYERLLEEGLRLSGESRAWFMERRIADLHAHLPAGLRPRRILDFGCGTGETALHLSEVFPGAEVVGVDTAESAVAHAQRSHGSARLRFGRVTELAAAGVFDLVYANGVFHHIAPAERVGALRAIRAALAPGGCFAFFENNPWNPGTRMVMARIEFDRDAIPVSPREARRLLAAGGFERVLPARFLFWFPRPLAFLRFLEPALVRLPLGAQYYHLAIRS